MPVTGVLTSPVSDRFHSVMCQPAAGVIAVRISYKKKKSLNMDKQ